MTTKKKTTKRRAKRATRKTKKKAPAKKRTSTKRKAKGRTKSADAPGSVIERTFKGKKIKVEVTADGFRYAGKDWRSLTAIAREVTGYKAVSGPFFFGLTKRTQKGGA